MSHPGNGSYTALNAAELSSPRSDTGDPGKVDFNLEGAEGDDVSKGCALERVKQMNDKELLHMRYVQGMCLVSVSSISFLLVVSAQHGNWGIFVGYIGICIMQATIRTLMDAKYDTADLEGSERWCALAKLSTLNFTQLRLIFDAQSCVRAGSIGMTINMTMMVEALIKNVPLTIVDHFNLLDAASSPTLSHARAASAVLCIAQIFSSCYETCDQTLNFEMLMNEKAVLVKKQLMAHFFCDVMSRTVCFAAVIFTLSYGGIGFIWVPFLVVYLNRVALMSSLFVGRGFVHSPEPPATEDDLSVFAKVLFGFFPAGFVQFFTDFPFNGDLASNPPFFILHQLISLSEQVLCVAVAVACNLPSMLHHEWAAYVLAGVWSISWSTKAFLFPTYYRARLPDAKEKPLVRASNRMAKLTRSSKTLHAKGLSEDKVMIYIKNECPACEMALALLEEQRPPEFPKETIITNIEDVEDSDNFDTIFREASPTGDFTIPVIFVGGKYVGGIAELKALAKP